MHKSVSKWYISAAGAMTNKFVDNGVRSRGEPFRAKDQGEKSGSYCLKPVLARFRRKQRLPAIRISIAQERTWIVIARGLNESVRYETNHMWKNLQKASISHCTSSFSI